MAYSDFPRGLQLLEEGRVCYLVGEITPVSESQKRWETALLDDIPLFVLLVTRDG